MLWNKEEKYIEVPFDKESDLEDAVNEVKDALFGSTLTAFSTQTINSITIVF